ncbi:MAG: sulfurtransferase-like selenium metabolism protein YedF [Peptostreptococcaceae bacterium]|jgi:selenium metabolism protein YedF|nr:sulfurtransferase-like selenium metabolism protein YedF [Peptostreptococcaceae bacterium]
MEKIVDARKLNCPMPVISTKKELEALNEGVVITIVDNEIAKENVKKLAKSMNLEFSESTKDGDFHIRIVKGKDVIIQTKKEDTKDLSKKVIFIQSNMMGGNNEDLGKILINGFVFTLTQVKPYPKAVVLVNQGVELSTINEETVENLKVLEEYGTNVVSCGTCLDFLDLKDKLNVGEISNMYDIVEILSDSSNCITIG